MQSLGLSKGHVAVICFLFVAAIVYYNVPIPEEDRREHSGLPTDKLDHSQHKHLARVDETIPVLTEVGCAANVPCQYPDEVDLRIIVIVYNRPESLTRCLHSLMGLHMDGDRAALEIWLDRGKTGVIHEATLKAAEEFVWDVGPVRVHQQPAHVGIYGQWIDTWRPQSGSNERAIFLEDDVDLSPYAYRWLKAAQTHFEEKEKIAGYALFEGAIVNQKNPSDVVFLHKRFGTQGFAPQPQHWRSFQEWYHQVSADPQFHPYVQDDATITGWYKGFEKSHKTGGMWSIWFIRYADDNQLWTVYPNMAQYEKAQNLKKTVNGAFLAYHRQEKGLHFGGDGRSATGKIISHWENYFTEFPRDTPKYGYNGKRLS